MKVREKLQATTDYALFENDPHNRDVDKIKRLASSMKKYGYLPAYPIHVVSRGGKLYVQDGGHRLAAAKLLQIPVYYVQCDDRGISIAEINNTQRRWSLRDYVNSYIRQGKEEYISLLDFAKENGITLGIAGKLLLGEQTKSNNAEKRIKLGTFQIRNYDYASRVVGIIKALKPVTSLSSNADFIHAVSRCCLLSDFDSDRFVKKAIKCPGRLVSQATLDDYLDLMESIYNDRARTRYPLRFAANEISKKRADVGKRRRDAAGGAK